MSEKKSLSFEEAFAQLETILQKMNEGKVSLEESLELFEQGNHLLQYCQSKLNDAEKKIEVLVKNRDGTLLSNEKGEIVTSSLEEEKSIELLY